jgi:hypothetical protein
MKLTQLRYAQFVVSHQSIIIFHESTEISTLKGEYVIHAVPRHDGVTCDCFQIRPRHYDLSFDIYPRKECSEQVEVNSIYNHV